MFVPHQDRTAHHRRIWRSSKRNLGVTPLAHERNGDRTPPRPPKGRAVSENYPPTPPRASDTFHSICCELRIHINPQARHHRVTLVGKCSVFAHMGMHAQTQHSRTQFFGTIHFFGERVSRLFLCALRQTVSRLFLCALRQRETRQIQQFLGRIRGDFFGEENF